MLTVKINHTRWTIPLDRVHYVDYTETLTLLPFVISPVEGLTTFNHQPLIQVSLAQAIGFENLSSNKRVIVTTPQGHIALRVDEVLDFVNQDSVEKPLPVLELTEILAGLETSDTIKTIRTEQPTTEINHSLAHLTALLVIAGGKTVALSSHTIDHIEEITDFRLLDYTNTQPDLLIRVKNDLLPAYSLTRFLEGCEENAKQKAIIVRGSHHSWALVVEQVLSLENIYHVYTTGTDTRTLWYIAESGEIREIIDANQLIGEKSESNSVPPIVRPQWTQPFIQMAEQLSTDGLRITCGKNSYVLPMTIVQRTLDWLDHSSMTRQRFPTLGARENRKTRLPWVNGIMLLTGKTNIPKHTVLITFPSEKQFLLGVDHALLQPMLNADAWLPLPLFPFPTRLFFDTATYDEKTQQWILRVTENIEFSKLPWSIKKIFVTAIIGWFDLETMIA